MDAVLSVTELTRRIKTCLEGAFPFLRVEGEVSNHKLYPSGHRYFSLKDEGAQIRVVLFRGRERFVIGEVRDGQTVIVTGTIGVYEKKGEYQIYAQSVEVRGVGGLLLELERRKARLAAEGLFDPARKRPLPGFPARVGIVTSREGAALRDMVRILRRRWPPVAIVLAPALVQGEGAAEDIARAIGVVASRGRPDVIIVGRGGGSIEDLWAFNEEIVVRAIAAAPVPTISAVGHETDFTLADLAADRRAPTPTAAAQMAVPGREEMADRVGALLVRARRAEHHQRGTARRDWRIAAGRLGDPRPVLQSRRYAVASQTDALVALLQEKVRRGREAVASLAAAVRLNAPGVWVSRRRREVDGLAGRAARRAEGARTACGGAFDVLRAKLAALDPLAVLARGYAIAARRATGRPVRSVGDVCPGDPLDIRVADGVFGAVAEGTKE